MRGFCFVILFDTKDVAYLRHFLFCVSVIPGINSGVIRSVIRKADWVHQCNRRKNLWSNFYFIFILLLSISLNHTSAVRHDRYYNPEFQLREQSAHQQSECRRYDSSLIRELDSAESVSA